MSTWSTARKLTVVTVIASVLLTVLLCSSMVYVIRLPRTIGDQDTVLLGATRFVPGSEAGIRVAVRDHRDASPVGGATIKVSLAPQSGGRAVTLYEGTTDALGTADVSFLVPEDAAPNQTLIVETKSQLGRDRVERPVTVQRDYRVLLTTDKPLYQPGQLILIRALALGTFDLKPAAGQPIEFVISDPKGNKVFRQTVTASDYGIASTEFQLADQVNTGPYKIVATLGNISSEKTVTVKHYVLPKFKVEASTDESFYLPGETVSGRVAANYFFGKPVSAGQVQINGYVFDVQLEQVLSVQGDTDDEGYYDFSFELPDYFVTSLESGVASFIVEVAVTDQAAHTERINLDVPVSQQSIIVDAVPESGQLRPGVENVIYVLTAYPDGTPAQCQVGILVNGQGHQLETGQYGLAEWRFTPEGGYVEIQAVARDSLGHAATQVLYLEGQWGEQVLLRPERAAYRVGETMHLDVFTSQPVGTVYLDIVREGQTVSTRALEITDGHAATDVDLSADLYGTVELHAYKILSTGQIMRDTRLVLVDAPTDLTVTAAPDKDTYLPGGGPDEEPAHVRFNVTDASGTGTRAALGIAVVDESVFALQEQDPGFLKLYFLLEREILQPRYQIKSFTLPDVVFNPSPDQDVRQAQDISAKAALAAAPATGLRLQVNSYAEKERQAEARAQSAFRTLTRVLTPLVLLLPLTLLVISVATVIRDQVLPPVLIATLLMLFGCVAVFIALPEPTYYSRTPLDKLAYYMGDLFFESEVMAVCGLGGVLLAGPVALITLA
ncbi:MAG: MG2 domain-containing protein, partial [Chloroflexota bacterium]|nr:MG2 domain-containing protein [Chloroflexota bacterium]